MPDARFAAARADQRARLIKLIHVGRRELGMADDTYRQVVATHAEGKTSTGDCSALELERVLAHLKKVGFKVRKPAQARPTESRPLATGPEAQKARAVWLLLHRLGAVRNPSEAALAAYVRRQIGVDDLAWAGPRLYEVIEALKKWAARLLPAALTGRLAHLQAVGKVAADEDLPGLLLREAPHRRPDTFDALVEVWDCLDRIEDRQ